METQEEIRGAITVTIRVELIKPKSNRKSIISQMEILKLTMGFTLLTASGYVSVSMVEGLIPHKPLDSMIHGPPL